MSKSRVKRYKKVQNWTKWYVSISGASDEFARFWTHIELKFRHQKKKKKTNIWKHISSLPCHQHRRNRELTNRHWTGHWTHTLIIHLFDTRRKWPAFGHTFVHKFDTRRKYEGKKCKNLETHKFIFLTPGYKKQINKWPASPSFGQNSAATPQLISWWG